MLLVNFDTFFQKVEELLVQDPVTSRAVIRYCPKLKRIILTLRNDKLTLTHSVRDRNDSKKIELFLHKAAQAFCNPKVKQPTEAASNQQTGGKKRKKDRM